MEFPATNISVYGALMLEYSSENSATCITRGSRDGSPVLKVRAGPVQLVQVPAPISTEPCASSDGEHAREHFHSEKNRSMLVTSEAPSAVSKRNGDRGCATGRGPHRPAVGDVTRAQFVGARKHVGAFS
jgi:hypothetical protein